MTTETSTQSWLKEYVTLWRNRLHLWNNAVHIHIVPEVDKKGSMAECRQCPNTLEYILRVHDSIEECEEWRVGIIHEMLHVLLGRVDQVVLEIMMKPIHDPMVKDIVWDAYTIQMEQVVHQLAIALYQLTDDPAPKEDA